MSTHNRPRERRAAARHCTRALWEWACAKHSRPGLLRCFLPEL